MAVIGTRGLTGRMLVAAMTCAIISACGKSSSPTSPTPATTPAPAPVSTPAPGGPAPAPAGVTLSGLVTSASGGPVGSARVDITAGASSGQTTTTDTSGRYTLANLSSGAATVRITAVGFVAQSTDIDIATTSVANVTLAPMPFQSHGHVFDATSGMTLSGITMNGGSVVSTTSASDGALVVFTMDSNADPRAVTLDGAGIVSRHTSVRVPGPDLSLSVIPSAFDLSSFDQMLRAPALYRWTTSPPLIVERRTLHFTDAGAAAAVAGTDAMTDAEYASLEGDLESALPQLTGGTYRGFSGVRQQTATTGDSVNLLNTGWITVVRMDGLTAATGMWGFGRFQVQTDGSVVGGLVMIDRDFDRSGNTALRALRTHELGHALGYSHVTGRQSVMNAAANVEPTDWDVEACRIAFERAPGNRSPDIDPDLFAPTARAGTARWMGPIK